MILVIEVKQKHIKNGRPSKLGECAIALAISDKLGCNNVMVGLIVARVGENYYGLPRSARRFITKFDKNKKDCKPFNFKLDVR